MEITMKLLLAEDTHDLNRAISAVLTHEGYNVDSVYDGMKAYESIKENSYDGIILDIMMPKMNGLEVLTEIRKNRITTPVLLLTAKAEIDDRVNGLDAGAELMQTLILHAGKDLTTDYLLDHVWEKEADAQPDTVWLYISYLRGKLRSIDSQAVIQGERGGSFRLEASPDSSLV